MSDLLPYDKLLKLFGIMQQMLVEATEANWQELNRLDSERRVLIGYDSNFTKSQLIDNINGSDKAGKVMKLQANTDSDVHQSKNIKEYRILTEQIKQLDRSIMKTVTEARSLSLTKNRDLAGQVKAKNGYAQTSAITSELS